MIDRIITLWRKPVSEPATTTSTDKLKKIIDATFEAAKVALRTRPIALAAVMAADVAIDAVWPLIFPVAEKSLQNQGIVIPEPERK